MTVHRLELTSQAEKALRLIHKGDNPAYKRIARAIDDIQIDPALGKPLKGNLVGRRSFRVGDYRIIYAVKSSVLLVIVIDVGHRQGIYKQDRKDRA